MATNEKINEEAVASNGASLPEKIFVQWGGLDDEPYLNTALADEDLMLDADENYIGEYQLVKRYVARTVVEKKEVA